MRAYRLTISATDAGIHCQASVHGWDPKATTWEWLPVQEWSFPGSGPNIAELLSAQLHSNGWRPLGDLPSTLPAQVPVEPVSRLPLLTLVQSHRESLQQELSLYDAALANLLADVPAPGEEGHLSYGALAAKLGLTRQWVRQMGVNLASSIKQAWDSTPDSTKSLAEPHLNALERKTLES